MKRANTHGHTERQRAGTGLLGEPVRKTPTGSMTPIAQAAAANATSCRQPRAR